MFGCQSLAEQKAPLGGEEIKKTCLAIVIPILTHTSPLLRVAAAHALGRLCQVINDGRFVSEMAGICFEKLKSARDMLSRTGYSLAIGYLHRFVGSLGSQANLNSAISILLALSQDLNSPVVQIWSLHSLSLVVDSGGPIFRPYIEATMHHSIKLLINASYLNSDVHQCAGRVLSALITAIGPELQEELDQIVAMRNQLLMASLLMQTHPDELVQVQAIGCLQQLHMFAAGQISLSRLVPALCSVICSEQLLLRSASINCLYQLAQRETNEVYVQANEWIRRMRPNESWAEHGLPGLLFDRLDKETQPKLCDRLRNVLSSLLQCLCAKRLNKVILLCKEVLTNAEHRPTTHQNGNDPENDDDEDDEIGFQSNDAVQQSIRCPKWATKVFATQMLCRVIYYCVNSSNARLHFDLAAARDAQRKSLTSSVLNQSGDPSDSGNFEFESCSIEANFLILHLSDLIRMAFMAATSDSDALRLEGLTLLELVIDKFAKVAEPEFSDHVVLEQYQAQVGAALRPAFAAETASHVTAKACQVCSAWIGSGVARDLNDLRRVYQLLVSSLLKLKRDSNSRLYNESASTMEKLAILKAWAEVYIVAMRKRRQCSESRFSYIRDQLFDDKPLTEEERVVYEGELDDNENLLQLVKPELDCLSKNWLNALKDHALLTLPIEFDGQLPHDGGAFYTPEIVEVVRVYYRKSWPFILHSVCLWLCSSGFDDEMLQINGHASNTKKDEGDEDEETLKLKLDDEHDKRKLFYLILGVAMESLCNPKSNEPMIYILTCLQSLETLFSHDFTQKLLGQDKKLCVELCNVLHRLLITRESIDCQLVILSISHLVYLAQMDVENVKRCRSNRDNSMDSTEVENEAKEEEETSSEGEDNATEIAQEKMELQNGQSLCYTLAEIALCVLVRQIPEVSLTLANTPGLTGLGNFNALTRSVGQPRDTSEQNGRLIGSAILLLSKLPLLCSPATSPLLLPTILYLLSNVFRYSGHTNESDATAFGMTSASDGVHLKTKKLIYEKEPVTSLLCAFEYLAACPYTRNPLCSQNWIQLLQSCLANILDFCKSCKSHYFHHL